MNKKKDNNKLLSAVSLYRNKRMYPEKRAKNNETFESVECNDIFKCFEYLINTIRTQIDPLKLTIKFLNKQNEYFNNNTILMILIEICFNVINEISELNENVFNDLKYGFEFIKTILQNFKDIYNFKCVNYAGNNIIHLYIYLNYCVIKYFKVHHNLNEMLDLINLNELIKLIPLSQIKMLLRQQNNDGMTVLLCRFAILKNLIINDTEFISYCVSNMTDFNAFDQNGNSVLQYLCCMTNDKTILELIKTLEHDETSRLYGFSKKLPILVSSSESITQNIEKQYKNKISVFDLAIIYMNVDLIKHFLRIGHFKLLSYKPFIHSLNYVTNFKYVQTVFNKLIEHKITDFYRTDVIEMTAILFFFFFIENNSHNTSMFFIDASTYEEIYNLFYLDVCTKINESDELMTEFIEILLKYATKNEIDSSLKCGVETTAEIVESSRVKRNKPVINTSDEVLFAKRQAPRSQSKIDEDYIANEYGNIENVKGDDLTVVSLEDASPTDEDVPIAEAEPIEIGENVLPVDNSAFVTRNEHGELRVNRGYTSTEPNPANRINKRGGCKTKRIKKYKRHTKRRNNGKYIKTFHYRHRKK